MSFAINRCNLSSIFFHRSGCNKTKAAFWLFCLSRHEKIIFTSGNLASQPAFQPSVDSFRPHSLHTHSRSPSGAWVHAKQLYLANLAHVHSQRCLKKKTITRNILKWKESCGAFISHTVTQYDRTIGHDFWFQTSPCFLHMSSFDTSRSEICQVTAAARCETSFLHLGDLCRVWWRYVHSRVVTSTVCGFTIAWGMNKYGKIRRQSGANPPSLTHFLWVSKLEGTQWLRPFWAKTRPRDTKFPCGA